MVAGAVVYWLWAPGDQTNRATRPAEQIPRTDTETRVQFDRRECDMGKQRRDRESGAPRRRASRVAVAAALAC